MISDKYRFPAVVNKINLSTKKRMVVIGEGPDEEPTIQKVDTPHLTLTLTYTDERAAQIAAMLANWQGLEVTLELEGDGRQLNLL